MDRIADLYTRVSTNRQEDNTSLESQEAACRAYAADKGYTVGNVYREVHTGAELAERPQLSLLRARMRDREIGAVIAYAVDRLSREQAHLYILDDEADRADVELLFVTEEFDKTPVATLGPVTIAPRSW